MKLPGGKRFWFQLSGFLLAAGVIWFLCRSFSSSWEDIRREAVNIRWGLFLLSVVIYAFAFLLTGWNWGLLQHRAAPDISLIRCLDIHVTSAFARYLPGGIWNIVGKAAWCTRLGAPAEATGGGIIAEYLFQIMSSVLFILFFLPRLFAWSVPAGAVLLAAEAVGIAGLPLWSKIGFTVLGKIFHSRAEYNLPAGFLYRLLGCYVLAWLVTGGGLLVLAAALSGGTAEISPVPAFAYPVSWVAGFLSPSPNGLGVRELVLKWFTADHLPETVTALLLLAARCWAILGEIVCFCFLRVFLLFWPGEGKSHV